MNRTLQLKITLDHITPPIWRRVLVKEATTLQQFHTVIQRLFGWGDCHLYQFEIDGERYGKPFDMDEDMLDARRFRLSDFVEKEKQHFNYVYDFGDCWGHRILVERILETSPEEKLPCCLAGRRATPPEDSGGYGGYYQLIELMEKKKGSEYEEMKEWLGGDYDSEEFDLELVNEALRE